MRIAKALVGVGLAGMLAAGSYYFAEGVLPRGDGNASPVAGEIDETLGIPAVVKRPNAHLVKPYQPDRKGLKLRYIGNRFSTNQPELAWTPLEENGRKLLNWQSFDGKSGLQGLYPGNVVEVLDDALYDFGVGSRFVKVKLPSKTTGYVLLETLIGEMEPADSSLSVARDPAKFTAFSSVDVDGVRLYEQTVNADLKAMAEQTAALLDDANYATALSGGQAGGVHPLYATALARTLLFSAMKPGVADDRRKEAIAAVAHFFDRYIEAAKVDTGGGRISWPYHFDWTMNWGIKLTPPWYSPFANSQVVQLSALMFKLTGEDRYRSMALASVPFITTRIGKGGSEYEVYGFKLPAEYVYSTPPLPNVRVLDGEFAVAVALYNGAQLLRDSDMLATSFKYFASLSAQLDSYTQPNGDLYFAAYIENMPAGYRWSMWALVQNAAIITKDRRFSRVARKLTPFIGKNWCDMYGC